MASAFDDRTFPIRPNQRTHSLVGCHWVDRPHFGSIENRFMLRPPNAPRWRSSVLHEMPRWGALLEAAEAGQTLHLVCLNRCLASCWRRNRLTADIRFVTWNWNVFNPGRTADKVALLEQLQPAHLLRCRR